jgi:endonuclease YncB( thermonuclease family)
MSLLPRLTAVCLMLGFAVSAAAERANIVGRVVAIADGDTITVLDASKTQHRIRLAGIDAPERGRPGGQWSKESLSALV